MKVDLDKTAMIHLLKGAYPPGELMEELEAGKLGYRDDDGIWVWDEQELKRHDNPQLYQIYKRIRY